MDMAEFSPGAIEFGPEDVTSVRMTFHLDQIGYVEFKITDDGGDTGKFVRDLYQKVVDTYGPGGSNPADSVGVRVIREEDLV
jgi:hypothetical protein